jgi:hypothetical protein
MAISDRCTLGERRRLWCNYHSVRQDSLCHFRRHWALKGSEDNENKKDTISLRGQEGDA